MSMHKVLKQSELDELNLALNVEGFPFHIEQIQGLSVYTYVLNNALGLVSNIAKINPEANEWLHNYIRDKFKYTVIGQPGNKFVIMDIY